MYISRNAFAYFAFIYVHMYLNTFISHSTKFTFASAFNLSTSQSSTYEYTLALHHHPLFPCAIVTNHSSVASYFWLVCLFVVCLPTYVHMCVHILHTKLSFWFARKYRNVVQSINGNNLPIQICTYVCMYLHLMYIDNVHASMSMTYYVFYMYICTYIVVPHCIRTLLNTWCSLAPWIVHKLLGINILQLGE